MTSGYSFSCCDRCLCRLALTLDLKARWLLWLLSTLNLNVFLKRVSFSQSHVTTASTGPCPLGFDSLGIMRNIFTY